MRKICPVCQGSFDTQFLCPKCSVQLLDVPDRSAVISVVARDENIQAMSQARQVFAGLLLAQGIYYAFSQFTRAFTLSHVLVSSELRRGEFPSEPEYF